jgi:hypothetical protein
VGRVAASESAVPAANRELVLRGQPAGTAEFLGFDDNANLLFRDAQRGTNAVPVANLVRWSYPPVWRAAAAVELRDGSRIHLAAGFSGVPAIALSASQPQIIELRSGLLGEFAVPRSWVRSAAWNLPADASRQDRRWRQLARWTPAKQLQPLDQVWLAGGDRVDGSVVAMGDSRQGQPADNAALLLEGRLGTHAVPADRLHGVAFAPPADAPAHSSAPVVPCWVGLQDGSLLAVSRYRAQGDRVRLIAVCGWEVPLLKRESVSFLQAGAGTIDYVDQHLPHQFEHRPTFGSPRTPGARGNVHGGPLVVAGNVYLRGVGVSTASRLVYPIPSGARQFVASVGVDDASQGGGSVVFRVALRSGDQAWREVARTRVVRGGESPESIRVAVGDATEIELATEYADRGDELDDADWLEARFE